MIEKTWRVLTVLDRYNEVIYVHWRGTRLFLINDSQVVLEGRKRGQVKQVFKDAQKEASTISTAGQEEISESCRGAAYDGGTLIGRLTYKHRPRCHSAVAERTSYKQRPRVQGACARSLNSLDKEIPSIGTVLSRCRAMSHTRARGSRRAACVHVSFWNTVPGLRRRHAELDEARNDSSEDQL